MALDEALMLGQQAPGAAPTLRFYTWRPACVTIGYFQRATAEVDLPACREAGVDLVRRPTGGRAVLHEDELTYSVAVRQSWLPGGVLESYAALCAGLGQGMRFLGIEGHWARGGSRPRPGGGEDGSGSGAACFDAASWYEILVGGRKIIGSAQTRAGGVILQHGSLLLGFDPVRLAGLLRPGPTGRRERLAEGLGRSVTSVGEQLGRRPAPGEVARALACGMAQALGLTLYVGSYTAAELQLARQLCREKYLAPEWTLRR